jgi:hypothetical protein
MKSEANPSPCNKLSHLALQSRLLGRYSRQLRKSCASANKAYSRAERVFIFEHYFESKSFAAVYEARCSAYSVKEVPNEAMVQFSVDVYLREDGGYFQHLLCICSVKFFLKKQG